MNENNHELGFEELAAKYTDFPGLLIRKLDAELRGVALTERALERAKEEGCLYNAAADLGQETPRLVLGGALFRDGSWVLGMEPMYLQFPMGIKEAAAFIPLMWLTENYGFRRRQSVEEVFLCLILNISQEDQPGTPMVKVVSARLASCSSISIIAAISGRNKSPANIAVSHEGISQEARLYQEG